tara:strand:+ start:305 stop:463 length:159 start_codon:yes stop_codon:yes gene_type:complete
VVVEVVDTQQDYQVEQEEEVVVVQLVEQEIHLLLVHLKVNQVEQVLVLHLVR